MRLEIPEERGAPTSERLMTLWPVRGSVCDLNTLLSKGDRGFIWNWLALADLGAGSSLCKITLPQCSSSLFLLGLARVSFSVWTNFEE
jgi:hypothetical protein